MLASTPGYWLNETDDHDRRLITLAHDPLVSAAAAWRFNKRTKSYANFEVLEVTMVDHQLADQMRNYYQAKLVELALTGKKLSPFRAKLASIINGRKIINTSELGLLHRLPHFYFEDLDTDWVFNSTRFIPDLAAEDQRPGVEAVFDLVPLRRSVRQKAGGHLVRYWFANQDDNPCCITAVENNVMLPMMDDLFAQPTLKLVSRFSLQETVGDAPSRGARRYWNLFRFRLAR
jgi:hypothetical protein